RSPRQVLNRAKLAAAVRQLPFRQFIQRNWLPGGYKQTFLWVRNCQIVSSRVRDNKHSDKSKYEERKDADGRRQPFSRACRPIISAIANRSAARSANGIRKRSQRHSSAFYQASPANCEAYTAITTATSNAAAATPMPTRLATGMSTCFGCVFILLCGFSIQGIRLGPQSTDTFDFRPVGT